MVFSKVGPNQSIEISSQAFWRMTRVLTHDERGFQDRDEVSIARSDLPRVLTQRCGILVPAAGPVYFCSKERITRPCKLLLLWKQTGHPARSQSSRKRETKWPVWIFRNDHIPANQLSDNSTAVPVCHSKHSCDFASW